MTVGHEESFKGGRECRFLLVSLGIIMVYTSTPPITSSLTYQWLSGVYNGVEPAWVAAQGQYFGLFALNCRLVHDHTTRRKRHLERPPNPLGGRGTQKGEGRKGEWMFASRKSVWRFLIGLCLRMCTFFFLILGRVDLFLTGLLHLLLYEGKNVP